MTRDDIIRMAEEAGFQTDLQDVWITYDGIWSEEFERFAALVAEREREACAKVCEENGLLWGQRYAAAIRARGET